MVDESSLSSCLLQIVSQARPQRAPSATNGMPNSATEFFGKLFVGQHVVVAAPRPAEPDVVGIEDPRHDGGNRLLIRWLGAAPSATEAATRRRAPSSFSAGFGVLTTATKHLFGQKRWPFSVRYEEDEDGGVMGYSMPEPILAWWLAAVRVSEHIQAVLAHAEAQVDDIVTQSSERRRRIDLGVRLGVNRLQEPKLSDL
jgi:hypothetical protein